MENLKNSFIQIPIISQTLNINNQRTTSAKSINLCIIRKPIEYSLKTFLRRRCLLSLFSRYCCSNVGRYQDLPSGFQGAKGLRSSKANQVLEMSDHGLINEETENVPVFLKIPLIRQLRISFREKCRHRVFAYLNSFL